ncbi:MAG: GNAT family N-acetyltransferase [Clostridiales Family XIII bacterium]|jgi:GNAT superfamily N-acetyltransferase|nr:GNAT family N-acetyltransferase [Clostridiales Family XIII bacterium]
MSEFKPVIINRENGLAFRPYITAEHFGTLLRKDKYGVGLLTEDGRAAGAAFCTREGDALVIDSVFVDETVRGRGAGTLLVDSAKALSQKLGTALCARYAYPSGRETELFFRKNGFIGPEEGNTMFSVPFETIGQSSFISKNFLETYRIMPFHEAPREAVFEYKSRVGKDIPAFASLEQARGKPIPEATLVCLQDGAICAFIVSTVLEDGGIYLNSLYAEKAYSRSLNALTQAALRALCEKKDKGDTLYIAAHNEAGLKIIRHLLRGVSGKISENITHTMVFYPENERSVADMEGIENALPVLDMLMPKLSGLSELMTDLGTEHEIVLQSEIPPYISTQTGEGEDTLEIRLSYIPTDANDEGKYVLTAMTFMPLPAGAGPAQMLCDDFNAATLGPVAHSDPFGETLYLRSSMPERNIPVSGELFEYFWELFLIGISDIKALTKESA